MTQPGIAKPSSDNRELSFCFNSSCPVGSAVIHEWLASPGLLSFVDYLSSTYTIKVAYQSTGITGGVFICYFDNEADLTAFVLQHS